MLVTPGFSSRQLAFKRDVLVLSGKILNSSIAKDIPHGVSYLHFFD